MALFDKRVFVCFLFFGVVEKKKTQIINICMTMMMAESSHWMIGVGLIPFAGHDTFRNEDYTQTFRREIRMADLLRSANAVWQGDLRGGKGTFSASSGAFRDAAYSFATRFENNPGTNPEELIAAAHAACFSMAFANNLAKAGFTPDSVATKATCVLSPKQGGGFYVSRMKLETEGRVPNIDDAKFQEIAKLASETCPISALLKPGLEGIDLVAKLV